jgi:uncharacterized membrane protein YbhN (UPF0104 family)
VLALSLLSWVVLAGANWACLRAIGAHTAWPAAVLVLVGTNFASVLPSTVGSLGVFEAAGRVSLSSHGVSATVGATGAIAIHAVNLLPAIVVGILATARLGLDRRDIRHAARRRFDPGSATIRP